MVGRNRKWQEGHPKAQGSFTVEAALILPIVLFCIFYLLNQGIELYCQAVELAENQGFWESFDPAGRFRQLELMGKLLE